MSFNNVINEYLKYFFVIGNMSLCKFIVKFVICLTSLIIKVHNHLKKIQFFYKILVSNTFAIFFKALLEIKRKMLKVLQNIHNIM